MLTVQHVVTPLTPCTLETFFQSMSLDCLCINPLGSVGVCVYEFFSKEIVPPSNNNLDNKIGSDSGLAGQQ